MRHLVAYTARTGLDLTQGVAEILTTRPRPSWRECAEQIPGYVTGKYLGRAPEYRLRYRTARGQQERPLTASGIERIGAVILRLAERETVWDIEVLDEAGLDVTFNFACFC